MTGPVTITGNTGTLPPPDTGPVHADREHGDSARCTIQP